MLAREQAVVPTRRRSASNVPSSTVLRVLSVIKGEIGKRQLTFNIINHKLFSAFYTFVKASCRLAAQSGRFRPCRFYGA